MAVSSRTDLTSAQVASLEARAASIRRLILRMVHKAGAGHLGGPLSAVDILTVLYFLELTIDPDQPDDPDRDRFVLSKGHSSPALYATLAERGFFSTGELGSFDELGTRLQAHPDMRLTPGVDMSTGSLGQGLSAAIGMALAGRLAQREYRTYVLLGDGECQEGQVWEAAMLAERWGLDSLTAIVDWNGFQQYGFLPQEPGVRQETILRPVEKWEAFGWSVVDADGHDVRSIARALARARATKGAPTLILARTIKGKGASFMENDNAWHSRPLTDEQLEAALRDLA